MEKYIHFIIISLLFCLYAVQADATDLLSGPMVGHTTSSSATIWVETDEPARVRVHYWADAGSNPVETGMAEGRTSETAPHTGVITLENLDGFNIIHYEIEIDGRIIRPETPQVFTLPPGQEENDGAANFSFAFASCMAPVSEPSQPVWAQASLYRPDFLMMIGDNNYMPNHPGAYETSEETVSHVMARTHRSLRDIYNLRTLLATTPTYSIWDDHDYGPNDSDSSFRWRDLSLDMFNRYWANPGAGTEDTPGIFYSFRVSDVEFFMLDDRYHRDPEYSTMLGEGQLEWLKNGMAQSTATFKVIVNGHVMLADKLNNSEYWTRYGNERDDFLDWMHEEEIDGVFFLSGDWHVGSLIRLDYSREGYPLYELISSNSGRPGLNPLITRNRDRQVSGHNRSFSGPIVNDVREFNFGMVTFSGEPGNRTATLQVIDYLGEVRIEHVLTEQDLSHGR
ncbi:MAG: alkaline phosphatase D family protein [Balneolaceae bacterium]